MIFVTRMFPNTDAGSNSKAVGRVRAHRLMELGRLTELNVWGEKGVKDRENAISKYDAWYGEVRKNVPAEKLLEYDVSMGWEPLCKFLNKPVPDVPFPREDGHSSAGIRKLVYRMEVAAWSAYAVGAAAAAAA
eukprot:scaffold660670_cov43-Prasinocladus_malaysianus.AAC.1